MNEKFFFNKFYFILLIIVIFAFFIFQYFELRIKYEDCKKNKCIMNNDKKDDTKNKRIN